MGNCCAKIFGYQNVYVENKDQQSTLELIKDANESEGSVSQNNGQIIEDPKVLRELFNQQEVDNLEQKFLQQINEINKEEFENIKPNLKNLSIKQADFYVKFVEQENSSYYDNVIIQEVEFDYTPEQVLLFILHYKGSLSKHTDINEDIILDYDDQNKLLRKINFYKSKKVLMIAPKFLLDIEVVKQTDTGYIIISRSCIGTQLEHSDMLKQKLSEIDLENLMETKVAGYVLEKTENGCKMKIYKNVNSKSSIGLRMAKGTLKSSFNYYLKVVDEELKKFVESDDYKDLDHYMITPQ